jgi:N-methylhydantoinase B/oxoprolinase/acetone carboxylase alpha subunit
MGYNLMRMGRTTIVKEIMDINCAVLDSAGGILAQAHLCPLMMFSLPATAGNMIKHIDDFEEGDVIICNDPYLGGQHLLDMQFFSPVFFEGELVAFVANIAHQLDMGGAVPGGVAGGLTEIYQEGLRIPFVKLYRKSKEDLRSLTSSQEYPDTGKPRRFQGTGSDDCGGVRRGRSWWLNMTRNVSRLHIHALDYGEEIVRPSRACPMETIQNRLCG